MGAEATTTNPDPAGPRVRLRDHFRVAWLLVLTAFAFLPYVVLLPLAPILIPIFRRRLRRALGSQTRPTAPEPSALRVGVSVQPPRPPRSIGGVGAGLGQSARSARRERSERRRGWGPRAIASHGEGVCLRPPERLRVGLDLHALAGKRIFLIAGEDSGDRMAAHVVREIRSQAPGVEIVGYAGPACRAAGMHIYRDLTSHAVMGVFAVVGTLGFWWRVCAETLARYREDPPDLVLTVDFPGLNVRLAGWARGAGIRTVHLVAPQVWAHAPWRIFRWRRSVDHLLSTMPFEAPLFEASRIRTTYVGHPLFEAPLPPPRTAEQRPASGYVVELWPGSRKRELRGHVAILAACATHLRKTLGDVSFLMPLAHKRQAAMVETLWAAAESTEPLPTLCFDAPKPDPGLLGAIVTSGTATAQVAVDLVPQVVFYRVALLTRWLARIALSTPWFCLANLVAGRTVAPEHMVGGPGAAAHLCAELEAQVSTPAAFAAKRAELDVVRRRLSAPDVALRTALLVLSDLASAR